MAGMRYHHVDWLRVLGMFVVFFYHAARIFDPLFWFGTFEVRNDQTSLIFSVFCFGVTFWLMPVFFLLAGASTAFALPRKTSTTFLAERVKRLLVPFVFYAILLIPPQLYMESVQAGRYTGSFWGFVPTAFQHAGLDFSTPHILTYPQKHLWFLWYLFFISLLTLPILRTLGSPWGKNLVARLAGGMRNTKAIFVFIAPLAVVRMALAPMFPQYQNYADFCYWSLLYVFGFVLYSDPRFEAAMVRERWNAFWMGMACYAGFLLLGWRGGFVNLYEHPNYGFSGLLFEFFWCVSAWAWLVFFIGMAKTTLNFTNRFLAYANEAILPFYILHKTVILLLAFNMALWPLNLFLKFVLLLIAAFAVSMALYEYVVKRNPVLRFLTGMAQARKQTLPARPVPTGTGS